MSKKSCAANTMREGILYVPVLQEKKKGKIQAGEHLGVGAPLLEGRRKRAGPEVTRRTGDEGKRL